jgi:hypothetical protein
MEVNYTSWYKQIAYSYSRYSRSRSQFLVCSHLFSWVCRPDTCSVNENGFSFLLLNAEFLIFGVYYRYLLPLRRTACSSGMDVCVASVPRYARYNVDWLVFML